MAGMFDDLIPPGSGAGGGAMSPASRDLLVRTVIGEAANEPDDGQAAVAHVIMNRVNAGKYGKDVPNVVLAKGQFEPWQTRANELRSIRPDDPTYRRASQIVDRVIAGDMPDPTAGATHFLNPDIVRQRRGGTLPAWAQGDGQKIGAHAFYAPDRPTDISAQRKAPDPAMSFEDLIPPEQPTRHDLGSRTAREGVSEPKRQIGGLEATLRGAKQGLTFEFGDELSALEDAAGPHIPQQVGGIPIKALIGLARLGYEKLAGEGGATRTYNKAVADERETTKLAEEQHPNLYLAGNVGGSVAGAVVIPGGAAARGATTGARLGRGAIAGGVTGALTGAGEGEGLEDTASRTVKGGLVGTAIGAAAPVALSGIEKTGQVIATAARPLTSAIRGLRDPEAEAARRVTTAIERDTRQGTSGLTPAEFAAEKASGKPVGVADLGGEVTRGLARSAANSSGEGRAALEAVTSDRFATQSPRTVQFLKETFDYPDSIAKLDQIQSVARIQNRPAYAKAYGHPNAQGMWDNGLEQLASAPAVQDAIRMAGVTARNRNALDGFPPIKNPFVIDRATGRMSLAQQADGSTALPNLQFWDHVKRNLDQIASPEARAASQALRGHLDQLVPDYQTARAGAAKFFDAEDALDAGTKFVSATGGNMAEARKAIQSMPPSDRKLFETGFLSTLIERVHALKDGQDIVKTIYGSPAAREKIELALGKERANLVEAHLLTERVMDRLRPAVQGNSTTTRQLAELGLAGGLQTGYGAGAYGLATGDWGGGNLIAGAMWAGAKGKIDQRIARRVGEMLASDDPGVLKKGINIVARNRDMREALRAFDPMAARVGGQQAPGSGLVPAVSAGSANDDQTGGSGPGRQ